MWGQTYRRCSKSISNRNPRFGAYLRVQAENVPERSSNPELKSVGQPVKVYRGSRNARLAPYIYRPPSPKPYSRRRVRFLHNARFDFRRAIAPLPPPHLHFLHLHRDRMAGASSGGRGGGRIGGSNSPPRPSSSTPRPSGENGTARRARGDGPTRA
jgi:hypothetical protein